MLKKGRREKEGGRDSLQTRKEEGGGEGEGDWKKYGRLEEATKSILGWREGEGWGVRVRLAQGVGGGDDRDELKREKNCDIRLDLLSGEDVTTMLSSCL